MYIKVSVTPEARKEKVKKISDTEYEMTIKEPARQNFANKRVREILAEEKAADLKDVRLITGHHSPKKIFDVNL